MAMKAKKKARTTAQRRAAAKAAWVRRRAQGAAIQSGVRSPEPGEGDTAQQVTFSIGAPGYTALATELCAAFAQSAIGKGKERHANGRSFDRQPIMELGRLYGPGFAAGQSAKKVQEALGMLARGEYDKALFEIHGGIVYLAAVAALLRETPPPKIVVSRVKK